MAQSRPTQQALHQQAHALKHMVLALSYSFCLRNPPDFVFVCWNYGKRRTDRLSIFLRHSLTYLNLFSSLLPLLLTRVCNNFESCYGHMCYIKCSVLLTYFFQSYFSYITSAMQSYFSKQQQKIYGKNVAPR